MFHILSTSNPFKLLVSNVDNLVTSTCSIFNFISGIKFSTLISLLEMSRNYRFFKKIVLMALISVSFMTKALNPPNIIVSKRVIDEDCRFKYLQNTRLRSSIL